MILDLSHANKSVACKCGGKSAPGVAHSCGCDKFAGNVLDALIVANSVHHDELMGREMLVVPVIMMKSDVVMNDCLVPAEEMEPYAWNGVPVTVRHPETSAGMVSANSPQILSSYAVGTLFNAKWDAGTLRAEAWVDIDRAESIYPGLIARLEDEDPMDVSTGYFSSDEKKSGTVGKFRYSTISRDIKPDHLALLPDEVGACSWQDGCGVRANLKDGNMAEKEPTTKEDEVTVTTMTKVLTALGFAKPTPKANERGEDPNDPRLMIADLISSDASPFCPDDQMALQMLTYDTLVDMRDHFVLGQPIDLEPDTNNSKGGPPVAEKDPKTNAVTMSQTELDTLVTNAVAKALADNKPTLSAEDTAALEGAKKIVAANHEKLVTQITANSKMTKEQLAGMSDAQLEVIANGLTPAVVVAEPVADFGGRAVPLNTNADETDPAIEAMVPPDPKAALIAHRKGLN